jgi:cell division protein FtsI (penicillin-binding protein 3)
VTSLAFDFTAPRTGSTSQGRALQPLDMARQRLIIAGLVFTLAFGCVAARLVDLMAFGGDADATLGQQAVSGAGAAAGERGDLLDRNGLILATTLPSISLYADPKLILDPEEAAVRIATVLPDLPIEELVQDLSAERRFVWIRRGLTPTQQFEINRLGVPGLAFQTEERRYYPAGSLTSHIVGYTDIDGNGLAGLERSMEQRLAAGEAVETTIDLRIQEMVRNELRAGVTEFRALGGSAIVMDVDNGEILAMVSLPDFNPYEPGSAADEQKFNRNTLGVYEMGSTFKIFNTAMALDSGSSTLASVYDARHPIRIGRFTITDFHPEGRALNVTEIFTHSSNIGSVHMMEAAGIALQREYLARFGLTRPSPIQLPEVGAPMVPDPWRQVNAMTIAFGHGMAVSPIQLVAAVGAAVDGGILRPPTLIRPAPGTEPEGVRVISAQTSQIMRRLMRAVVTDGTASFADAPGYLVGGKTGTADKTQGRGYRRNARMSSFVGAFPMHDPRYVVFVVLDEPQPTAKTYGYATGGWTAAPLAGRIVEQMGPMVGVAPVDPEDPRIVQALAVDLPRQTDEVRLTPAADH